MNQCVRCHKEIPSRPTGPLKVCRACAKKWRDEEARLKQILAQQTEQSNERVKCLCCGYMIARSRTLNGFCPGCVAKMHIMYSTPELPTTLKESDIPPNTPEVFVPPGDEDNPI